MFYLLMEEELTSEGIVTLPVHFPQPFIRRFETKIVVTHLKQKIKATQGTSNML
jgi:hypothetical protein